MKRMTPGSLRTQHIQSVIKAVQELSSKQLTLTLPSWVYTIAIKCPVWKNYWFRNLSLLRIQIYTNVSVSSMPPDYRRVVIQVPWSWHCLSSVGCIHHNWLWHCVIPISYWQETDTEMCSWEQRCPWNHDQVWWTRWMPPTNARSSPICAQVLLCPVWKAWLLWNVTLERFITKKGDLCSLPCTEDAFTLHAVRALHQLVIYKWATQPDPSHQNLWNLDDISTMAAYSQREQQNQQNPTLKKRTANAKMANVGINAHVTVLDQIATLAAFAVRIL